MFLKHINAVILLIVALLGYAAGSSGTIIYETDRAWHAVLRKTWNKAFSGEALHEYEPIIIRRSAELVAELDKRVLNEVDISKWMDYFS